MGSKQITGVASTSSFLKKFNAFAPFRILESFNFNSPSFLTPLKAMDVNGVLLSHELPSLYNNSDEGIIKKYEPAGFDFLTMSVGNDDQPKEYGSVDEFIQSSLNEPNSNGIEDEPELVGNSPKPEEAKLAGKKRGRQPPKDKPKSVPSSPPVAK